MPKCFFLPGLLGTTLGTSALGLAPLWVSVQQLAAGQVGRMQLAGDGVSPGGPYGRQLYAGEPLGDYYFAPGQVLSAGLAPHGYTTLSWGYDWRKSARVIGPLLAGAIRANATSTDPCALVCHSFGGLVARVAWSLLGATGDQGRIRRIITLGTPHWGSYAPVRAWTGADPGIVTVVLVSVPSAVYGGIPDTGVPFGGWSYERVAAITASWPSFYESLPSLLSPDAASDPGRAAVYGGGYPPAVGVRPELLADARDVWQPFLASSTSTPPPWVLTTIAGNGLPTPATLQALRSPAGPAVLMSTGAGDGTVAVSSALLTDSARYTVQAGHSDLDQVADYAADLVQLVLDQRGPPAPAPPPVVVRNPLVVYRSPPPLAGRYSHAQDC